MKTVIILMVLTFMAAGFTAVVSASERCVEQYGGICKEVCAASEESAEGAFIDCDDKQNCCVKRSQSSESKEKADQAAPKQEKRK